MCDFDTLYFGNDGYVARCKECERFQIAFGTSVLTLNQLEFEAMTRQINSKLIAAQNDISGCCKNILLVTPSQYVQMCVTKDEALRFQKMMEDADTEMQTLAMLKMFEGE